MYYEEKLINGVLHWRNDPNGEWIAYTQTEVAERYLSKEKQLYDLYEKYKELESENNRLKTKMSKAVADELWRLITDCSVGLIDHSDLKYLIDQLTEGE